MNNIGYILIALVLFVVIVYLVRGKGVIANNLGRMLRFIICIALILVLIYVVMCWIKDEETYLPGEGSGASNSPQYNEVEDEGNPTNGDIVYEITIRSHKVEIRKNLIGNIPYIQNVFGDDDIDEALANIEGNATVIIYEDYADYGTYKAVIDKLVELDVEIVQK